MIKKCFVLFIMGISVLSAEDGKKFQPKSINEKTLCEQKADKIYIKNKSAIKIFPHKITVWHAHKLHSVKALYTDDKGIYVKKIDLKNSLAKLINSQEKSLQSNKRIVLKAKWKCEMCGAEFNKRDDLYDHIWWKHGYNP